VPGGPNSGRSTGVSAFDASTGTLLWNSNFSGDSYGIPPPPIMLNGVLYEANDSSCGSLCAYALPGEAAHREHPKRQ
jgi:outer membrane protein assembly factor BamB